MIYRGWYPFLFSEDATVPDSSLRSRSDATANHQAKALELISRLYAVERALPPLLLPSDDPTQREHGRQREEQRRNEQSTVHGSS